MELLVDSAEFWERIQEDLAQARERAWIQTFSFEGDAVGTAMARALEGSPAADRRLLVDGYSLLYHNDRLIPGPALFDSAFRAEVRSTHAWTRRLRAGGVGVRFGNPLGPSPLRLLRRSHKKVAVFDGGVAYLGGINFCDHNFAWHDLMLRVEDPALAAHLAADFDASWNGRSQASDVTVGSLRVLSLNGRGNPRGFRPVVAAIRGARRSIDVVSPYLSPPFTDHLGAAVTRGVPVRVLTPARNNKSLLARSIREASHRHDFEVLPYHGRMNHMKAMVIDDEILVVGSSNFDLMSYHLLEELFVITRAPDLLEAFRRRVWRPDTCRAPERVRSTHGTRWSHRAVRAGSTLAAAVAAL
jgi:cardiolipin synthase